MILGIDPSYSGSGIIFLDDTPPPTQLLIRTSAQEPIYDRVQIIITAIDQLIGQGALDIVSIEGFAYASPQHAHQMGYLGYRIREYFVRHWSGVPIIEPSPTQVKKFATGKGVGEKDIIIKEVFKRWGFDTNNNNLADAYVLAQIGRAYLDGIEELPAFQQEVITALKGEKPKKKGKKASK